MNFELYKLGSRGEMVRQIQKALGGFGLKVLVDGIYGPLTKEAVEEFQRRNGLKVDGIVGPATLTRLIPSRLKKSKRKIGEIIVHCTATPEGRDHTAAEIRLWHTTPVSKGGRGWSDIGYHYVVRLDGTIENGRDVDISGAHCAGHNAYSIGVVYVGGCEATRNAKGQIVAKKDKNGLDITKDTRTQAQKAALQSLLYDLKRLYPTATIYGHHDFETKKACPCFDAREEYRRL